VVYGTPTTTGTASFTATVTDSASHTKSQSFTIAVTNQLTITTASLPITVSQELEAAAAPHGFTNTTDSPTQFPPRIPDEGLSLEENERRLLVGEVTQVRLVAGRGDAETEGRGVTL